MKARCLLSLGPSYATERKVAFDSDGLRRSATGRDYRELALDYVGHSTAIGGERNLINFFGVRHGVDHACCARRRGGCLRENGERKQL